MISNKLLTSTKQGKIEPAIVIADRGNRLTTIDINKNKCYQTMVGDNTTRITYITYLDGVWYAFAANGTFRSEDALHWVKNYQSMTISVNNVSPSPFEDNDVYPYIYYGGTDNGYSSESRLIFGNWNPGIGGGASYNSKTAYAIPNTHVYYPKDDKIIYGCITYSLNSDPNKIECVYFIKGSNAVITRYELDLDDITTNLDGLDYRCTLAQPEYVESEDMFYMAVKVINWSSPTVFGSGSGKTYTMVFKSPTAYSNLWTKNADRTEDSVTIFHDKLSSIVYNKLIDKSLIFSETWKIHLSNKKLGDGLLKFDDLVKLPNIGDSAASNFVVPYKDGFIRFSDSKLPRILIGDMASWETLDLGVKFNNISYACSNEEYFI